MSVFLSDSYWCEVLWSERWFVVATTERPRCRGAAPRVVTGSAARLRGGRRRSRGRAGAAAEATASAAAAARLVDLGGGVPKRGAHLLDPPPHDGALLP